MHCSGTDFVHSSLVVALARLECHPKKNKFGKKLYSTSWCSSLRRLGNCNNFGRIKKSQTFEYELLQFKLNMLVSYV